MQDSFDDVNEKSNGASNNISKLASTVGAPTVKQTKIKFGETLNYSEFDRDDLEDSSSNINDRASFSKITSSRQRKPSTVVGKNDQVGSPFSGNIEDPNVD